MTVLYPQDQHTLEVIHLHGVDTAVTSQCEAITQDPQREAVGADTVHLLSEAEVDLLRHHTTENRVHQQARVRHRAQEEQTFLPHRCHTVRTQAQALPTHARNDSHQMALPYPPSLEATTQGVQLHASP